RRIEIHRSRFARETDARAIEPRFQLRKSAELERVLLDRKKLEDAAFGDDLAFALDDRADVVGAQRAVADDGLRDRLSCLIERQSRERVDEMLRIVARQVDANLLSPSDGIEHAAH